MRRIIFIAALSGGGPNVTIQVEILWDEGDVLAWDDGDWIAWD